LPNVSNNCPEKIKSKQNPLKFCFFTKKVAMTRVELKNRLIQKIKEIDDIQFLEAIKTILDSKSEKTIILTEDQEEEILLSQSEVKEGLFIEQKEIDEQINRWLKEK